MIKLINLLREIKVEKPIGKIDDNESLYNILSNDNDILNSLASTIFKKEKLPENFDSIDVYEDEETGFHVIIEINGGEEAIYVRVPPSPTDKWKPISFRGNKLFYYYYE